MEEGNCKNDKIIHKSVSDIIKILKENFFE